MEKVDTMRERDKAFCVLRDTVLKVEGATKERIFSIICCNLRKMAGAVWAALASYDPASGNLVFEVLDVEDPISLPPECLGATAHISKDVVEGLIKARIENCAEQKEGLVESFFAPVLEKIARPVDKATCYQLSCAREGQLIAVAALQLQPGQRLGITELVDAYLNTAGVILQRMNAVAALRANEEHLEELRANVEQFRSVVQTAKDAIISGDSYGNITSWNPTAEALFGYSADETIGQPLTLIMPSQFREMRESTIGRTIESTGLRKDGSEFLLDLSLSIYRRGGEIFFTVIVRDITERRRAEDALLEAKDAAEAANRAKSTFLANMSHELRTPLNAVIGYSELLQEEARSLGHEDFVPDLEKIRTAGHHLTVLISDILDLSKIEAGKMELYLETFELVPLIQDVVDTIQPLVAKNDNTLKVDCPADLGVMHADSIKIRQILLNLLNNAAKFTERGAITLAVAREAVAGSADWIRFCVTDTGIGITPEQMEYLFLPFTQVDGSTTRQYGGSGLGLAISQRLCQMLGGEIGVESTSGRGSTFTVRLPATVPTRQAELGPAAEVSHHIRPPVAELVAHPPGTSTVLVVDDDSAMCALLERWLAKEKYRVETASSGKEGLRLARELRPDVITLDVLMPGMSGWAVLSALKTDPELADVPVVLVTFVDNRDKGFALGASDYLLKPIDQEQFVTVLQKYQRDASVEQEMVVKEGNHD